METIKLQDKLQEIKDDVAVKHDYYDWDDLLRTFCYVPDLYDFVVACENEVAIAFAAYCCERQRKSDYKLLCNDDGSFDPLIDEDLIKNNKLITDEL